MGSEKYPAIGGRAGESYVHGDGLLACVKRGRSGRWPQILVRRTERFAHCREGAAGFCRWAAGHVGVLL